MVLLNINLNAQNIKDEELEYRYIKMPSSSLEKNIVNYQARIVPAYEEKNRQLLAEYEQNKKEAEEEYQKAKAAYPALVKAAEEKYNKEMEEYNKKELGKKVVEKIILGENNKPVKQIPSEPQLRFVQKPKLQNTYDYPVLANTYLHLDGFQNNSANAVNIVVTLYGFDCTEPMTTYITENKTGIKNGSTYNYTEGYYKTEFSYRHPLSVKVTTPDGKEILNVTPQEFNNYKNFRQQSKANPQTNSEMMIKTYEEKILQENLTAVNDLVNSSFGYPKITRKALLFYVKSKDGEYSDLMTAYNEASSGLKILADDESNARPKISEAMELWKKALQESEPTNKKARIDKDVTIAICFNLLEADFALRDVGAGLATIKKLDPLDISSKERKRKDDFERILNELKIKY